MRRLRSTVNAALTTNVVASHQKRAVSTHRGRDSVNLSSTPNPMQSQELLSMLASMLDTYRSQQKSSSSKSLDTLDEKQEPLVEQDIRGEEGPCPVEAANRWQTAVNALTEHRSSLFTEHNESPTITSDVDDSVTDNDLLNDFRATESVEPPVRRSSVSHIHIPRRQESRSMFTTKEEKTFLEIISAAVGNEAAAKVEPGQRSGSAVRNRKGSWFTEKQARRLSRRRSVIPLDVVQHMTDQECRENQCYFHPFSFARLTWEAVVTIVAAAHVIMAPLYFAWKELFIYQLSYAVVLVFVIDWMVQGLTSYMKTDGKNFGLWEKDPATLITFYLRTFFILDFVIAFPLTAVILQHIDEDSVWNILSLLDIIKIIRVKRAFNRFKRGTLTNPSLWKVIILWCVLLYVWHLLSCIYWLIEKDLGLDETTMGPPIEFRDTHFLIEYSWAVFWVVSVNAGSATFPEKPIEAILASFVVMTGIFVVAGVISTMNNAVREYDTLEQRRTRRLREIMQYLRNRKATAKLIREVLRYYQYCFENNIGEESGADLLNELPTILRERLIKTFYKPIIEKIPLFDDLPKVVLDDLVLTLERRIYVPGEFLIIKGEIGREMYIISYGRIRVELGQHQSIFLGEGDYLGEQAVLTSAKRNASAFCESHCELLVLRRSLFHELSSYHNFLPMHVLQRSPQYKTSTDNARKLLEENVLKRFNIAPSS